MYGSVEGVADIASTWTINGEFLDPDVYQGGTNPPLATVQAWLVTMSAIMDAALMDTFFTVPLTSDFAVSFEAVGQQVNALVSDLVAGRNSTGRFYLVSVDGNRDLTNWKKIQDEIISWVNGNVQMFLAEGVPQITKNEINYGQRAVILQDDEFND